MYNLRSSRLRSTLPIKRKSTQKKVYLTPKGRRDKIENNELILHHAPDKIRSALYLDSEHSLTTRALLNYGAQTLVSVNLGSGPLKRHRLLSDRVRTYEMMMSTYLRMRARSRFDRYATRFDYVYLDYELTLRTHMDDIWKLFENKLLYDDAVFALCINSHDNRKVVDVSDYDSLMLSKRGYEVAPEKLLVPEDWVDKNNIENMENPTMVSTSRFTTYCADYFGYDLKLVEHKSYRMMNLLVYRVYLK